LIDGRGKIVCIDGKNGREKWAVNAYKKFEGVYDEWEIAESLLVVDDKVIYTPGGYKTTMVALNKHTGETIWTTASLRDSTAYVSPLLIRRGGRQIIVNVTSNYLVGVDAADGVMLWNYKYSSIDPPQWHPRAPIINCNTPLYHQGRIFVTSGYDHLGAMFSLSGDGLRIEFVWKAPALDTHVGGVVLVNGYIFGSNWISNSKGNWVCLDWETGKVMYEKEWQTKGSIISAENRLYCYDERRGNVALVRAVPDDFDIVSSFRITQGKGPHWAHPIIDDGVLYLRHGDVLMAYDIRDKNNL
jgi:outer membrane protein assembly factor BamB